MPPRRVVADSDEDSDEDDFSPVRYAAAERPDTEPLSPLLQQQRSPSPVDQLFVADAADAAGAVDGRQRRDSRSSSSGNHVSDQTDPSFFANVYREQQQGVVLLHQQQQKQQQSRLVENIVRQSQKASASSSSGEVSLPAKGKKAKNKVLEEPSSGTDVTSPFVFKKPLGNQVSLFDDDGVTQVTTPRKSAGAGAADGADLWDVPSSPPGSWESSRTKKKSLTTYGKRRRGNNTALSPGSAGSKIFNTGEDDALGVEATNTTHRGGGDDDGFVAPSPMPPRKKPKISLHEAAAQSPTTFYIAQSNLTTMQKLQYQKVSVPANPYDGMAGAATPANNNPKSSGVTTIAYSTPSYYAAASSGFPLPSTEPQAQGTPAEVIDIPSSPDIMTAETEDQQRGRKSIFATQVVEESTAGDPSDESMPPPLAGTPPSQKKRKKPRRIEEEADELSNDHDDIWDVDAAGTPREMYRPRPSRKRSAVTSIHEDETAQQEVADSAEPGQATEVVEPTELGSGPPTTVEAPAPKEPAAPPAPQPKKRGRKKKQPVVEVVQDEPPGEETAAAAEVDPLPQPVEVEEVVEKPKKKRGRPRKSDQAKTATTQASRPPPEEPEELGVPEVAEHEEDPFDHENDGDEVGDSDEEASEQEMRKPRSKKVVEKQAKKGKKTKSTTNKTSNNDDDGGPDPLGDHPAVSPLTEFDSNAGSRAPASRSVSVASEPTSAAAAGKGGKGSEDAGAAKTQGKAANRETGATTAATSKSGAQPKAPLRVGLSKKSRIAPLLKIIRK